MLHFINGGICNGGDDSFYIDFGNWIVAQGKELCSNFIRNGYISIIDYIKSNNITEENYEFESFIYVFNE